MHSSKARTARIALYKELQHVPAVYTLETSFSGNLEGGFYNPAILKSIGRDLCRALIPYCGLNVPFIISPRDNTIPLSRKTSLHTDEDKVSAGEWRKKFVEELKANKELLEMGSEDSGSDSNPSEDNLPPNVVNKVVVRRRHKINLGKKAKARKIINASSLLQRKLNVETRSVERIQKLLQDKSERRLLIPIKAKLTQRSERSSTISGKSLQQISSVAKTDNRTQLSTPKKNTQQQVTTADAWTQTSTKDM
eukprot:TRINITY_DN6048_c0_g3_i1.p1 TRINITY_DN6048_c0_g3~~TRINITY_DN6048_c0_g3_i1.p1  ORF type:complete len:251 (-),score=48.39 TRINITY_DN6048_c0_g3_i1:514-1266(-)